MTERRTDPSWDANIRRELERATSGWRAQQQWTATSAARKHRTPVLSALTVAVVTAAVVVGGLIVHSRVGNAPQSALPPATAGVPTARSAAAAAYDPVTKQTVMFGGLPGGGSLGDTWTWNGQQWLRQHPPVSPHARVGALMAFDPVLQGIILLGGQPNGPTDPAIESDLRATWLWDARGWHRLTTAHTPILNFAPFWSGEMAFDASSQRLVLVSATAVPHEGVCSMDTWTFDGHDWNHMTPSTPLPSPVRILMADGTGGVLALLNPRAALVGAGKFTPDCANGSPAGRALPTVSTWSWTGATWIELTGPQPPPSDDAPDAGAALVNGHALLVTGQLTVWSWQGSGWQAMPALTTSPQPRSLAAVAADGRGHLIVFGGELQQTPGVLADTWAWDGARWSLPT